MTAIGLRAHSGWAALVVVDSVPQVLDRRRIVLADPRIPGSKQPFHAAEPKPFAQAENLIQRCVESTNGLARNGIGKVLDEFRTRGVVINACGILLGSGRALGPLESILKSHALIHTAEGEMFREALQLAANGHGVRVSGVKEREVQARAASAMGIAEGELAGRLAAIGKPLGPPWTQDEKLAMLAGWLALR